MRTLPVYNNAWWQQPLVREIAVILAVKIALIFLLWWLFFHLPDAQRINTTQVSAHLAGPSTSSLPTPVENMK
jgi:hypothetical protein